MISSPDGPEQRAPTSGRIHQCCEAMAVDWQLPATPPTRPSFRVARSLTHQLSNDQVMHDAGNQIKPGNHVVSEPG